MPEQPQASTRLRHPIWLIVLFGGVCGAAINLSLTLLLHETIVPSPFVAFFIGTLANQLFHFVYYRLALYQIRYRDTRRPIARAMHYLVIGLIAVGILYLVQRVFGPQLRLRWAILIAIAILSLLNLLLVRISTFASAQIAMIEYTEMHESFYAEQLDTTRVNAIRAWFHRSRFDRLREFVVQHYKPGMQIADLGCGNCMWNTVGLPVTGVDVNRQMMEWAKQHNHLIDYRVQGNLASTMLPDKTFDIVIMSETLEHLLNLDEVLGEVRRILKDDGVFLITVPYDYFFGPFFFLFNVNCIYQGFVRGSKYHRARCGHVNHFTKRRLTKKLAENAWGVRKIKVVNTLSLYAAAEKQEPQMDTDNHR
jgi:2-polyprenyl-3-methyl-5-hydroxy-6-metoxy-1,4-benzoquinol methylase/putative flippase GtrA